MRLSAVLLFVTPLLLAGCDQLAMLGLETPAQQTARADAEGKAIGSSCRHSGRALEDCYQINPKASKSAIFNGWREMDAYMRENKLEAVPPQFPMNPPASKKKPGSPVSEATHTEAPPATAEAKPAESTDKPIEPGKTM